MLVNMSSKRGERGSRCCQVQGCTADLSCSKEYHRKHKVCEKHSKSPTVVVGGQEQRFCQQCSRFHTLDEFDQGKRSCRKRLAGHNERRRKPQLVSKACSTIFLTAALAGNCQQNEISIGETSSTHPGRICRATLENLKNANAHPVNRSEPLGVSSSNSHIRINTLLHCSAGRLFPISTCPKIKPEPYGIDSNIIDSRVPIHHLPKFQASRVDLESNTQSLSYAQDPLGTIRTSGALSLLSSPSWSSGPSGSFSMSTSSVGSSSLDMPVQSNATSSNGQSLIEEHNSGFADEKLLAVNSHFSKCIESRNASQIVIQPWNEKQLYGGAGANVSSCESGPYHGNMCSDSLFHTSSEIM
eukprot:TRINITY_DN9465_c0_g1_i1.p1 TRINITY_DN9465_c0_g1~~TRINITY_DN9465_c0_g1_i1.p1  ORF type:complete len:356 (+),score=55.74 TRINITY_DN9465_c0_g1_i1:51-1118(+)